MRMFTGLICSLLMYGLAGCTTINYEWSDGRKFHYTSSKDITAKIIKEGEDITIIIESDNEGKMELLKGILGAMK